MFTLDVRFPDALMPAMGTHLPVAVTQTSHSCIPRRGLATGHFFSSVKSASKQEQPERKAVHLLLRNRAPQIHTERATRPQFRRLDA